MRSLYVDKFLIAAKYQNSTDWLKSHLKAKYNVKDLGEAKIIIGWQIIQDPETETLKID